MGLTSLRQTVAKVVKQAAKTAGITAPLATHTGRRSVVTTLYAEGEEALEDIAKFVGHARSSTTAGYVKRLGAAPNPSPTALPPCSIRARAAVGHSPGDTTNCLSLG